MTDGATAGSAPSAGSGGTSQSLGGSGGSPGSEQSGQQGASEGQGQGEAQKPKIRPLPKMRTVKVDGQDRHIDEDKVFANYQKYESADSRLKELARKEKEIEEFWQQFEQDPNAAMRSRLDAARRSKLAESWMEESVNERINPKDPRDAQLAELQAKLKAFEGEKENAQKAEADRQRTDYIQQRTEVLEKTLIEAMKESPLATHGESKASTLREMALYLRAARERGEDPSPADIMSHIESNRMYQMHTIASQYEGEQLLDFFGPELGAKLGKAYLDRVKSRRSGGIPQQQSRQPSPPSAPKNGQQKFIDPRDELMKLRGMK